MYGKWDAEEPMVVAKFVQYSADYMHVTGCNGKAYPRKTIPVYVGRRATNYGKVTAEQWRELRRGSPQEFMVNEVVADLNDARIVGELNRFRGEGRPCRYLRGSAEGSQEAGHRNRPRVRGHSRRDASQHVSDRGGQHVPHHPSADALHLPTPSTTPHLTRPPTPRTAPRRTCRDAGPR